MGNDVELYLPPDVEPRHLAEFFSLKLGAEPLIDSMEYGGFSVHPHIDLVKAEPSTISGMEYLTFETPEPTTVPATSSVYKKYILSHPFQPRMHYAVAIPEKMYKRVPPEMKKRFGKVWNQLAASSSPQRLALFRAAADFFGGIVVPQDVEDKFEWHKRTMPVDRRGLLPEDDLGWRRWQMAMYWVAPLTREDIQKAWKDSGYKTEDTSIKNFPFEKKDLPITAYLRHERLDNFKPGPSTRIGMVDANHSVTRKLKAGPGTGWWGEPVRHKMAAKKGHANKVRRR